MKHYIFEWQAGARRGRTGINAMSAREAWNKLRKHVYDCTSGKSHISYVWFAGVE